MEIKLVLGFFNQIFVDLKDGKLDEEEIRTLDEMIGGISDMVKIPVPVKKSKDNEQIKKQNEKMKLAINRLFNHLQTYLEKPRGGVVIPTNMFQY